MKSYPIEQIAKLAKAAADTFFDPAVVQNESLKKAASCRRAADISPNRERLAGLDHDAVERLDSEPQICDLVVLQIHLNIAKRPQDERSVFDDRVFETDVRVLDGKRPRPSEPLHLPAKRIVFTPKHRTQIAAFLRFRDAVAFHAIVINDERKVYHNRVVGAADR